MTRLLFGGRDDLVEEGEKSVKNEGGGERGRREGRTSFVPFYSRVNEP